MLIALSTRRVIGNWNIYYTKGTFSIIFTEKKAKMVQCVCVATFPHCATQALFLKSLSGSQAWFFLMKLKSEEKLEEGLAAFLGFIKSK